MNMVEADGVYIFQKCHSHILLEIPAEVLRIQRKNLCGILQGNRLRLVTFDIIHDLLQTDQIPVTFLLGTGTDVRMIALE